jgi:sugar lactone lactonase YvrE
MRLRPAGGALACVASVLCAASVQACSASSEKAAGDGGPLQAGDDASAGAEAGLATDAGRQADAGYPPLKFADIGAPVPISTQFYFTEGPVWDPTKGVLYFTDINAPQGATVGGAIYRLTLPSTFDVLLQPDGNADGLGLDPQGNLIAAGFVSRDVWRLSSSNGMQTLGACAAGGGTDGGIDASSAGGDGGSDGAVDGAVDGAAEAGGSPDATDAASPSGTDAGALAGTCYAGQPLNTPDDITSRSDGVLYFTDPTFASGSQGFPTLTLPLSGAQGVYRLTTDGVLHLEDSSTTGPNGVNLSPDQKTLYVSYTLSGQVAKFDVGADGSLSNKATFATGATVADSMCVDAGGNVYVGTYSGLAVYDPTGKSLGTISVGGLIVTNCAFGAADQKTLFITARTQATLAGAPPLGGGALYKIDGMPVPGIPGQN